MFGLLRVSIQYKHLVTIFTADTVILTHIEPSFWMPKRVAAAVTGHAF